MIAEPLLAGRLPASSAAARRETKRADEVLHPGAADQHGGVPTNRKGRNGGLTGPALSLGIPVGRGSAPPRRPGRWRRRRRFCYGSTGGGLMKCGHGRRRCASSVYAENNCRASGRRVPNARTSTCRFWSVPQWTKFSSWSDTGRVVRNCSRQTVIPCIPCRIIDGRSCLFRQREPLEFVRSEEEAFRRVSRET